MASNGCQREKPDSSQGPSKLKVTILASEWGSNNGSVSTIIRELAIQLAKFSCLEVTFFLPKCSEEDKEAADGHGISILEAARLPGFNELDQLCFTPENLRIDVVVGHGIKLGRQAQVIRNSHKCKWVQVVHNDARELGIFQSNDTQISKVQEEHDTEVALAKMADLVVGVGPKLTEAFRGCLSFDQKDVFEFTPGVFADFDSVQHSLVKKKHCVLFYVHGDAEDFKVKEFDIAAKAAAAVQDTRLMFVRESQTKQEVIVKHLVDCGIDKTDLRVIKYMGKPEHLKRLFCEVDLVLMPSRTEGFGLIGLQALSAGLPFIVSKNSGFGEALCNVKFGSFFVIDSNDLSAWTVAIKEILTKERTLRLDEIKFVRGFYGERYHWSEQCKRLIKRMVRCLDGMSHILVLLVCCLKW